MNAGILLLRQKNPADALPLLTDAVEQKPDEFRPRFYLAEAQLQSGAFDAAEASYRRALELDAKSAASELGLGAGAGAAGQTRRGGAPLPPGGATGSEVRRLPAGTRRSYEKNRQPEEAIAIYREFPNNAAAQRQMAQLMMASRQYADAIPQLESAFAKSATQPNRVALAKAYLSGAAARQSHSRCSIRRSRRSPTITTCA